MTFAFEDLKIYRENITWLDELNRCLIDLGDHCPPAVKNEVLKNTLAIVSRIAEAQGNSQKSEKIRLYESAQGAIFACRASIHAMARMGLLEDDLVTSYFDHLAESSKMLKSLIRSAQPPKDAEPVKSRETATHT